MVSRKQRRIERRKLLHEKAVGYNEELGELQKDKDHVVLLKVERPTHIQPPYVSNESIEALMKALQRKKVPKELSKEFCTAVNEEMETAWRKYSNLSQHAHHRRKHRLRRSQGIALTVLGACTVWVAVGVIPLVIGINMIGDNNTRYSGVRSDYIISLLNNVMDRFKERFSEHGIELSVPSGLSGVTFNSVSAYEWEFFLTFHFPESGIANLNTTNSETLQSAPEEGDIDSAQPLFSSPPVIHEDEWSDTIEIDEEIVSQPKVSISPQEQCDEDPLVTDSVHMNDVSPAADAN